MFFFRCPKSVLHQIASSKGCIRVRSRSDLDSQNLLRAIRQKYTLPCSNDYYLLNLKFFPKYYYSFTFLSHQSDLSLFRPLSPPPPAESRELRHTPMEIN